MKSLSRARGELERNGEGRVLTLTEESVNDETASELCTASKTRRGQRLAMLSEEGRQRLGQS
jgi:hypothetical protein